MTQTVLPRWRGFNLLNAFTTRSQMDFQEDHFRWIADWGFNFVRIPACYTLWIENDDAYQLAEPMLAKMDRVVQLGQQYGVHVCLNFHRGPGYSVNPERLEPYNLWKDAEALRAFCFLGYFNRFIDLGDVITGEFNVYNAALDLHDSTGIFFIHKSLLSAECWFH